MVSVDKISVLFGGFALFEDISFLVNTKDRIGLVGKNGAGKTTLLKILCGKQNPTTGILSVPNDFTFGYLPQHMVHQDGKSVREEAATAFSHLQELRDKIDHYNHQLAIRTDYESEEYLDIIHKVTDLSEHYNILGGENTEGHIEKTLTGLGFVAKDLDRPTSEFSGGWRMRIELAKLLLQKPDMLLLDEPTNHLDIESIQWLEDFLKTYPGSVVLVSHDKAFLDNVTNRTIEITLGRIYDYKVPYSKFLELREERRETQKRAYENQQKQIKDTEAFIERFRYKATKAVQVQSRIKQLEKMDVLEIDEEDNSALNLRFPPAPRSGTIVVEAENYKIGYGSHVVLNKVNLIIERVDKVAFVGKNGEGKSTLVKAIIGDLGGMGGELKTGHNVKVGYFAQNQADLLDGNLSVFETIDHVAVGDVRTKIRDILAAFMFRGEDIDKKVKVLSGGERSRLAMIKLLLEPVNLLVLDEPTNHLDIRSKEVLKQAINEFDGTAIVVSHDRDFLDGLSSKLYEFGGGKVKEHLGTVYEFLHRKKMETLQELERKNKITAKASQPEQKAEKVNDYEERKALNKQISYAERKVKEYENLITQLEGEIEHMKTLLANPDNINDASLYSFFQKKEKELEKVMREWEEASLQLDDLNGKL
ncbi:ABC-F family ATP-binding cassette domain-containing protein [Saccharicrinis sp. FJH62]|uniref:ABC-F family ATP-binding cassette domain-containing protein n=1 Tax=Saccharicrinis sp. FJH62 TaxID=3344657 RepID=UPI0035D45D85